MLSLELVGPEFIPRLDSEKNTMAVPPSSQHYDSKSTLLFAKLSSSCPFSSEETWTALQWPAPGYHSPASVDSTPFFFPSLLWLQPSGLRAGPAQVLCICPLCLEHSSLRYPHGSFLRLSEVP